MHVTDEMVEAARFLLDRLNEFSSDFVDDAASDWHGHVAPAMSRLEAALRAAPAAEPVASVLEQAAHVELGLACRGPDVSDATRELIRRVRALTDAPQCCMCGKTGLSTVEGDGGSECQLSDGRWTCSFECWERATERDAPPAPVADGWVLVPREPTRALTQAWQVAEDDSWALQPDEDDPHVHGAAGYRAMLAAAPTEAGR